MSNYNDYKIQLGALLDANAKGDLQKQADAIKDLSITVSKLNLNKSAIEHLKTQLAQNGIDINLVLGNTDKVKNETKQVGQQIGQALGNQIEKDIKKGIDTASSSLKSFSDLQSRLVNNTNLFNLNDFEKQFDGIKKIYSEFGQVKITDALFDDGQLQKFKVNIEQVNGDLKETRSFIMSLNDTEDHFVFSGLVKGSESIVQHLDKSKNAINQTGDAINDLKHKLQADKLKLSIGDSGDTTKQITLVENGFVKLGLSAQEVHDKMLPVNNELSKLNTIMSNDGSNEEIVNQFSRLKIAVDEAKNNLTMLRSEYSLLTADDKLLTGKFNFDISNINNQLSKFGELSGETFLTAKSSALELQQIYNELKLIDGDDNKKVAKEKEYQKQLEKTKNLLKELKLDKNNEVLTPNDSGRIKLINNLTNFLSKNTAITKENRKIVEQWIATLSSSDDILRGTVNNIKLELSTLETKMRQTGELGLSFGDKLKQAWEKFGGWTLATSSLMTVVHKSKQASQELKEIDNILTEISKTSDLTKSQIRELGNTSFESANKFGKLAADYLQNVQEMSQSGFYGDRADAMAQQAMLAQAAGNMGQDIASKYIIATNAAYKFNGEAERLNEVLDGQNNISNRNSVALKDMALAMSEAGTIASEYRVSIEDFSAMVGTIESITKVGGQEVGNSLKSILINLQNVGSSKISDTLDRANASMYEFVNGTKQLRDPINIIRDLSKTFTTLEKNDPLRAEILTNVAGKHQSAKLAALLSNMDMFDKMLVDYSQGAGSALIEAEKSASNLTGSLNELSNTWTSIVNNVASAEKLTPLVQTFNSLLKVIESLTGTLGTFGTAGLLTALGLSAKNIGFFKTANNEITMFDIGLKKISNTRVILDAYKKGIDSASVSTKTLAKDTLANSESLSKYISKTKASDISLKGYVGSLIKAKVATVGLQVATFALNAAMSLGISFAISGLVKWINSSKEATKAALESVETHKSQRQSLSDLTNEYSRLKKSLDAGNLSTDESRSIKEQLIGVQKSLIESFGDEASGLDFVNGKYQENLDLLRQISKEQAEKFIQDNRYEYENKTLPKLNKEEFYDFGEITSWYDLLLPQTDEQKKLLDFIENYSNKLELIPNYFEDRVGMSVGVNILKQDAEEFMRDFFRDLEEYAEGKDIDVSPVLNEISKHFQKGFDDINKTVAHADEYVLNQVIAHDTLSELYRQSESAVNAYNKALSSGEGVTEAKAKFDSIKQSVSESTNEIEGSQKIFDNIFETVNKNNEKKFNISVSLDKDKVTKDLAEQLRGLDDLDLQSINLDNIEHPFVKLIEHLELSSDQVPILTSTLAELGYVHKTVSDGMESDPLETHDKDHIKELENFISLTKTVKSALEDVSKISTSDLLGFMKDFPSFDWKSWGITGVEGVGNINGALKALVETQFEFLSETDKVNEGVQHLRDTIINNSESVKSISELVDALKTAHNFLTDTEKDIKEIGEIGLDTISKLYQAYPQLRNLLNSYLVDKSNEKELLLAIQNIYKDNEKVYSQTIASQEKMTTEFINELNNKYQVGIKNHASFAEARLQIESELISTIGTMWSNFYDASTGVLLNNDVNDTISKYAPNYYSNLKKMEGQAKAYAEIQGRIDKIASGVNFSTAGLSSSSKKSKENKEKKDTSQTFDWIEVKLKRIQEAIDRSKKKAETFINYLKKNKQLKDVEKLTNKEITANKDALSFYNKKLKASTLDDSLKKLVKNGKISIGKYDENTTKKIQDYQKWYEAAQNTKDKLKELKEELKEIGQLKLSNISEYFNIRTGYVESKISKRQSLISMRESQGKKERLNDIKYIEQLQKDEITYLEKAKKAYEKEFNKQVTNGLIKKYSPAWYEGKKAINEYTQSLYDLKGQLAETGKEIEKFPFIAQDKKREKYDKKLSEIDNILDLYDDEDIEKIALQQAGLSQAVKKAELTRKQLNKLEKEYAKNNISKSVYEEQKDKLQEELNSNAKAIKGYNDGIISSMKARYDEELKLAKKSLDDKLKLLEKEKKEKLDALKDELDAYKKIIDEQKKAIQDKQKEDKYQKEIAKYAKDISELESRIERLKLAEQSGDQTARKERLEAEENLSKLKEELDEKQKDKEIENAVDALDEEYKKFEEVNKKETDKIEKQYEIEKELAQEKYDFLENKIEKLYENERQLIVEAAQLTQDEFSKVFDAINTQLKSYGLEISPELSGVVGTTQSDVKGQAKSSDIEKILGKKDEKNKLQNMSSLSGLNKYIASAGYKTITKAQMVELAKSLGLDDITKTSQVGTDDEGRKNKNRILAALKNARFAKGGTVTGGMTLPEMVKYSGEDGIAFVSKGEEILNPFHASIFEDFVKQLDVMHKTGSSINTNHSPTVVVNLPANSVIDNSAVNNWRSCVDEISNAVSKQILNGSKLK